MNENACPPSQLAVEFDDISEQRRALLFQVDDLVDTGLRGLGGLTDRSGASVGLLELDGPGYAEGIRLTLAAMCGWVKARVQGYREHVVALNDLAYEAGTRVEHLPTLIAHGLGAYAPQGRVDELRRLIEACPGYVEYLTDVWNPLVHAFTDGDRAALAAVIEQVLLNLGLWFEDLTDGRTYLHVSEPHFCTDSASSG